MPLSDNGTDKTSRRSLLIIAIVVVGFGITLLAFYPGVMTYDAKYVYLDIARGFYGDWQSPVMTSLWALIDPLAPGPASMFLLIATLYWLGFGLLAVTLARRSIWPAVALLMLALSPPVFMFVGIIWRDVLLASVWLLAAALAFAVAGRGPKLRMPAQALALCLLALGVLLRPNGLIAAPILAAYIAWPRRFRWRRSALLFVPAALGLFGMIQLVYYGVLGATRQYPLHSLMVFDLGGISHFAKENQFPGRWTEDESQRITNRCYKPVEWDIYWRLEPCQFVMQKLEKEQHLFGTPAVSKAWLGAILRHPIAHLEHRLAYFWNFLSADNLTLWVYNIEDLSKQVLDGRASFAAMQAIDRSLKPTPLLRVGTWWLLCLALCALGWRHRDTPAGAFVLGVSGSGTIYVLTFLPAGVAADFRYGYWAVLAAIGGAVVLAANSLYLSHRERSPAEAMAKTGG